MGEMASTPEYASSILFYLNGQRITVEAPDLDLTLLQYLRSTGLTGTKLGCGEGGCGACTVMVSRYSTDERKAVHTTANACLYPLYAVDGKHVITVEGLGTAKDPHPVQERIALLHGSQCGFCTPGFVMSLYTLLRNNANPSELEIEECFDGNLCRCTGYRPILDAAKTFADEAWKATAAVADDGSVRVKAGAAPRGCGAEGCCQLKGGSGKGGCGSGAEGERLAVISRFKKYDPSQELIFPPFLVRYAKGTTAGDEPHRRPLRIASTRSDAWCRLFYRPLTLHGLLEIVDSHPACKLVAGNTEVGVEVRLKRAQFPVQVYVGDVAELCATTHGADGITFGANMTLARFAAQLDELCATHAAHRVQGLAALRECLRYFAGNQIRNVATIAGNIVTASPISDLNPAFLACGATLVLASRAGTRSVRMADFFLAYRSTAMRAAEVLVAVHVPFTRRGELVRAFKQAKRKDDDIAIVTSALRVQTDPATHKVTGAAFAFGGVAPTTVIAKATSAAAVGGTWGDPALLDRLVRECQREMRLAYDVPGGMAEYRTVLTTSFLFKFWAVTCAELGVAAGAARFAHELADPARGVSRGSQAYAPVTERAIVGKGVAHLAALKQATGEARYIDDMPQLAGELHLGLVVSPHAHARIVAIDCARALATPGVVRVLTHRDVPGANVWNIFRDEEILPSAEVHYAGQPVALVVAESRKLAQHVARTGVAVEYEVLPAVLGIRDAVALGSLFAEKRELVNGDVAKELADADFVFEGESYCGAQEHFYLETMGCVTVPRGEDGEFEVFNSTQNPTETQMVCAEALGVPASRIVARVKRMGGGFGGKESRSTLIGVFTALAAFHTNRSARLILERDEDMQTSGQRHPFLGKWTVGVARDGRLRALRIDIYSNGGFSHDLSLGVLDRAVSHVDNCYRLPASHITGRICRTNTQSNTAFRSFGGCQGMILLESMLCEVADRLGLPVEHLRELNMYRRGDVTPFSQALDSDWNIPLMWTQLKAKADYDERRRAVDAFNAQSRYRKRGLALLPTKFGISFGVKHLNQGMALVHVYMDGSVLVAHGGTEMGQGLHTKMAMVAAETLEVPLDTIFISETATNTAANTSPTAASASSDLNGYAVHNACRVLADRLRPYRERHAGEPFAVAAKAAYLDRCDLSATGHYLTPDIGYDWATNSGQLFFYFTQGVAAAEVELDTLTGAHSTRRVDILMDVGDSLNKAIDIGQIEGAFAQGQGWTTTEEFLYSPSTGRLVTQGPGNYKIPSALDIPRDFRVELLEGVPRSSLKTIFSSKGVGEPPLFLGSSVFFALRDAVKAARSHNENATGVVHLEAPATAEVLRLACEDSLVEMARIPDEMKEGKVPFTLRI